ncbi:MAG: glycosyltransferase family 9 protein [bacterium]
MENIKILIIQTSFIGDAVLTLPMIQILKGKYPNSNIDVLTIPATESIFSHSPSVANVIVYDKRGKDKGIKKLLMLGNKLKSEKYDLLFSPHRSFRSAVLTLLSQVQETYGFDNASLKYAYKYSVKYKIEDHEVLRNLTLAGFSVSEDNWKIFPKININETIEKKIDEFLINNKIKNYVCIAPGSVWETKVYPVEYYNKIIEFCISKNYSVVISGSSKEMNKCLQLEKCFSKNVVSSAGLFSIIETIELIRRSNLLICNDSAPTHFGMAVNVPVITLYCSTVAKFGFYPYNKKSIFLSYDNLKCKPCGIHGYKKCPVDTFDCAVKLKPEMVFNAIDKILV